MVKQTIEEQLSEAYAAIDELQAVEARLRKSIATALEVLKGEGIDDDAH